MNIAQLPFPYAPFTRPDSIRRDRSVTTFLKLLSKFYILSILGILFISGTGNAQISVTATGGDTGPTPYTTLRDAFAAINAGTHTQSILIEVTGDVTESDPAVLNASSSGAASYTDVLVRPAGGMTRTISGAIAVGSPLIDLNGADHVTFDGLNTGGDALIISNTTASNVISTSTIRLINGATQNTITRCSVLGSFSGAVNVNGGTIYFATDIDNATGNSNNTISYCDIGPAGSNLSTKGIYSNGTTTTMAHMNEGIQILHNNIYDYFSPLVTSSAISLANGSSGWIIQHNKMYQTAARVQTTGSLHTAIRVENVAANGFTISDNIIGYANSAGTGTYTFTGPTSSSSFHPIYFFQATNSTASSIQGNTITAISMNGNLSGFSFIGIYIQSGNANIGNITPNIIGSATTSGAITFSTTTTSTADLYGIRHSTNTASHISNNIIGGIHAQNTSTGGIDLYGINASGSTSSYTLQNNIVGFADAPLVNQATSSSSNTYGLYLSSGASTITGNVVRHLTMNGANTGTAASASLIGIRFGFEVLTGNLFLSQNTIHDLSNSSGIAAVWVIGIYCAGFTNAGMHIVSRNLIHTLSSSSTSVTSTVNGLYSGQGTVAYLNNMIALGASITNAIMINGVLDASGSNSYHHNSVYIGGSPTTGSANSFAFSSTVTTNTRSYRNNIFFNARNNNGATGKNYVIRVGGTSINPPGLTINNNLYYANGTGSVFGLFNAIDRVDLAAWQAAVGQDVWSFHDDPQYNDPTHAAPDLHLHPTLATLAERNGFELGVVEDFDGEVRADLTPVDIGADAGDYTFVDMLPPMIELTPLASSCASVNQVFSALISDVGGIPAQGSGDEPRVYYRKNSGSWFSQPGTLIDGNLNNGEWSFTILIDDMGGVSPGDTVSYYVVAQDVALPTARIASNPVGVTSGTVHSHTPPATPNVFHVYYTLSGTYAIGESQSAPFHTLSSAVQAFNVACLTGPVVFELEDAMYSTSETFPVVIESHPEASPVNTLTLRPASGTAVLITGSSGTSASGLIKLNGADYVTIDGINNSGASLMIENTSVTGGTAVIWLASKGVGQGATNNTVTNCHIRAGITQNTSALTTFGIVISGATLSNTPSSMASGADNDDNRVIGNSIVRVRYGVFTRGISNTNPNFGTIISHNIIGPEAFGADQIGRGGVVAGHEDGIVVSHNTIRFVGGDFANTTAGADRGGITFGSDAGWVPTTLYIKNAVVYGNHIHHIVDERTFSASGIVIAANASPNPSINTVPTNNLIANNMIHTIKTNGTAGDFPIGIGTSASFGDRIVFNSIYMTGDTDPHPSATTPTFSGYGISISSTVVLHPLIKNNIVLMDLSSSSAPALRHACINIPSGYVWGDGGSDHNNFYISPGNDQSHTGCVGGNNGTYLATLGDWWTHTYQDNTSRNGNPQFISATNLHIDPSMATAVESAGIPVTGVTDDFDGDSRNAINPDIGADEGDFIPQPAMQYVSCTTTQNNTADVNTRTTKQEVIGIEIFTTGASEALSITSFEFNTHGTTNLNDITNAQLYNTGTNVAFNTLNQFGTTVAAPAGNFTIDGSQLLFEGINYFWLTYDVVCTATVGNAIDAECTSLIVDAVMRVPTLQAPPGERTIVGGAMSGEYTVGTGGNYPTLAAALSDIGIYSLGDHTTLRILENMTLTSMLVITEWPECGDSDNSLTISPAVSTSPVISGNVATSLIQLNGADRVIIDGSNNGSSSKDLTLRNTHTSARTLQLINDATYNIFKNTIIESVATSTIGTVHFGTSTGPLRNSFNLLENCDIRDRSDAAGLPGYALTSEGLNTDNTISGCNIYNWTIRGVSLSGSNWIVQNNSFYQTATRTTALVAIAGHGTGQSILNNHIGGTAPLAGGSHWVSTNAVFGIHVAANAMIPTQIHGNIIKNIRTSVTGPTASFGIYAESGLVHVGTVAGNFIGSTNPDERFDVRGNNSYGINITSNVNCLVSQNIINRFGSVDPVTSPQILYGMRIAGSGSHTVTSNEIRNITNYSRETFSSTQTHGIDITSSGVLTLVGNTIEDIGHLHPTPSNFANTIAGIRIGAPGTAQGSRLEKNIIRNIFGSSSGTGTTADQVYGIWINSSVASMTVANNMISLSAGNVANRLVSGILSTAMSPATNSIYYNSVSIGGTASGNHPTYAFSRSGTGVMDIRNNIFSNTRSGGTGFHVSIANTNVSTTGWPPEASDFNILHNLDDSHLAQWLGTAAAHNRDLAGWQTDQFDPTPGSGGDLNSLSGDPGFISSDDLHIDPDATLPAGNGTPLPGVIDDDIDSEPRDLVAPDIGADEFGFDPCSMVTHSGNAGAGTLRDVIACAPHGGTIIFSPALDGFTIGLEEEIWINKNLTINGPGAHLLTVSGSTLTRIFHLAPGKNLHIKNISLKNSNSPINGGAIWVEGDLMLENVLMENNLEDSTPKALTLTPSGSLDVLGTVQMKD